MSNIIVDELEAKRAVIEILVKFDEDIGLGDIAYEALFRMVDGERNFPDVWEKVKTKNCRYWIEETDAEELLNGC